MATRRKTILFRAAAEIRDARATVTHALARRACNQTVENTTGVGWSER